MNTLDQTLLAEANRWLDKAVRFESDGKPSKIVELAFEKAWKFEQAAFGLGPVPQSAA